MNLVIAVLFWATGGKREQLEFWNLSETPELPPNANLLLSAKCGKWIPIKTFHSHLTTMQLTTVLYARISREWQTDASSPACRHSSAATLLNENFLLGTQLRDYYLKMPDWPVVSPDYARFCKRSYLANLVPGGTLITSRFARCPGHPLIHLLYVGEWPVLTIMALRAASMDHVSRRPFFHMCCSSASRFRKLLQKPSWTASSTALAKISTCSTS